MLGQGRCQKRGIMEGFNRRAMRSEAQKRRERRPCHQISAISAIYRGLGGCTDARSLVAFFQKRLNSNCQTRLRGISAAAT